MERASAFVYDEAIALCRSAMQRSFGSQVYNRDIAQRYLYRLCVSQFHCDFNSPDLDSGIVIKRQNLRLCAENNPNRAA
jgi:hypothetical protein